jgi:hypothetical protein
MTPWSPPDWPSLWPIFTIQPRVQRRHSTIVQGVYVGYLDCSPMARHAELVYADLANTLVQSIVSPTLFAQSIYDCSWATLYRISPATLGIGILYKEWLELQHAVPILRFKLSIPPHLSA